jgi:hypothetical protein
MLVFDTETTIDETQALNFGVFGIYQRRSGTYVPVQEGLFYADDLPNRYPSGLNCLRGHCVTHSARTVSGTDPQLYLLSRAQFVERIFWRAGYLGRSLIVGFNLPFDLTRLALYAGYGRGRKNKAFSLAFWGRPDEAGRWRDVPERPRVRVRPIDSKLSFIQFTRRKRASTADRTPPGRSRPDPRYSYPGRFADLRTLSFAMTGRGHTLASACNAFGVAEGKGHASAHGVITPEYIEYCRQDVRATAGLMHALGDERDLHFG